MTYGAQNVLKWKLYKKNLVVHQENNKNRSRNLERSVLIKVSRKVNRKERLQYLA